MKKWQKTGLIILCFLGMGLSPFFSLRENPNLISDKVKAPVHINIEIDKNYRHSVEIIARLNDGNTLFNLTSQTSDAIKQAVLHNEIINLEDRIPYIYALFLRIPKENAQETINAIEAISIFIGNKLFYFSSADIANFHYNEQDNYLLYELPGLEYKESKIMSLFKQPSFINYYGDLNLIVSSISVFITYPNKFIFTWLFLVCLIILCRNVIKKTYLYIKKSKKPVPELTMLGFIVLLGFILRINDYMHYSSWFDDLYSSCIASNPTKPFMSTFVDFGNPPFYFILLRIWFQIFGWTEQSGRLLSVLIGCAAIIVFYIFIKRFSNKKCAFLGALYMATSSYFIGYSQNMRCYILIVLLLSIAAHRFLIIIQDRELKIKNLILYIIPSTLLVNTHYWGSLFVFVTFLFYVFHAIRIRNFKCKNILIFFVGNVIIVSSLLPYIIHTVLKNILLNSDFNSWLKRPGFVYICLAVAVPIFGILYLFLLRPYFNKMLTNTCKVFLEYSIFVIGIMYLIAFTISQYQSVLSGRYFIFFYTFLIAVIAIILVNVYSNSSRPVKVFVYCFALIWIIGGYESDRGGATDVYHESIAYISKDVQAHPENISMEILPLVVDGARFYNYDPIPQYNIGDTYDVLYYTPHSIGKMYSEVEKLGINHDRILQIRVTNVETVFKIYAEELKD